MKKQTTTQRRLMRALDCFGEERVPIARLVEFYYRRFTRPTSRASLRRSLDQLVDRKLVERSSIFLAGRVERPAFRLTAEARFLVAKDVKKASASSR